MSGPDPRRPGQRVRRAAAGFGTWLALGALSGCATTAIAQRPYPMPDPGALVSAIRARQAAVQAVDLETRTTSWLGGDRVKATVLMLVDRSGRLRFEAEVALQGNVATLATDGADFALLDLQAHVFKRGPACPENVASLIPVPLRPAEVAAVLLGDAPIAADAHVVKLDWDGEARADRLELDGGAGSPQHLWIHLRPGKQPGRWDIVGLEGGPADPHARWRVSYEDLATTGPDGLSQPATIRFAEPTHSFDDGVEIKVKSRKVNPALRPQAFTLSPPEGFPVETLPCCPGCTVPRR